MAWCGDGDDCAGVDEGVGGRMGGGGRRDANEARDELQNPTMDEWVICRHAAIVFVFIFSLQNRCIVTLVKYIKAVIWMAAIHQYLQSPATVPSVVSVVSRSLAATFPTNRRALCRPIQGPSCRVTGESRAGPLLESFFFFFF